MSRCASSHTRAMSPSREHVARRTLEVAEALHLRLARLAPQRPGDPIRHAALLAAGRRRAPGAASVDRDVGAQPVLVARAGVLAQLAVGRVRRVDLGRVGVAAVEPVGRVEDAAADRVCVLAVDPGRDPRGDEAVRAQVAHAHLDALRASARASPGPRGSCASGALAAAARILAPAAAVEQRQVARLPVRRPAGLDAQQLAAVARPVERAVVVVPAERHRLRRRGLDRPALVVEPRIAAVERRRGDQRADRRPRRRPPSAAGASRMRSFSSRRKASISSASSAPRANSASKLSTTAGTT